MAGVMIYKSLSHYYSFTVTDNEIYKSARKEFPNEGNEILWDKEKVDLGQIENARKTINAIVGKLNNDQEVNFKKELSHFFE